MPMMVIAMMTAAMPQPTAIHSPPKTSHKRFSKIDTGDMRFLCESRGGYFIDAATSTRVGISQAWRQRASSAGVFIMSSFLTRNARGVRQNSVTRAPDIPNVIFPSRLAQDAKMQKTTHPKKQKCKNCEGKGTLKKGDKVVRCQRCGGSGIKRL